MENKIYTHGSMFFLLKRFIEKEFGAAKWKKLNELAGTSHREYNPHENYPVSEMDAIIYEISQSEKLTVYEVKEKFGESMVPDLMGMYRKYVDPSWKTFELLEYTEHVMHKAVRREESKANPPVLNVSRVHDKLLIIDYNSNRRMASLAVGIIKGIAKYYKESEKVKVIPVSDPNDERVQLRVEFS